jgi:hypothetical protein
MFKTILSFIKVKGTFNKIITAGEYAKLIADTVKYFKNEEVSRGLISDDVIKEVTK